MSLLAIDIGGANLKAADGLGFALSREFPLWRTPERLADALDELIAAAPVAEQIVATMTGELADCFPTKAAGVAKIVAALAAAARNRAVRIYLTDGTLAAPEAALARPLSAAASNWHALARFAARYMEDGNGLLFDVGSTTCDIIPIHNGSPAALGQTDPERLASGELVYTGVVRSPICAVARSLPWRGTQCPTAHELFATTLDAYLITGELPEEPQATATADGRPATRACARDRLARSICADREIFSEADAQAAAAVIREAQSAQILAALGKVVARMSVKPGRVVLSGQGEFLARYVLAKAEFSATIISLAAELGPVVSRCAPAHALAVLARETLPLSIQS